MLNEKYSLTFNGKYYRFNIKRINEICVPPKDSQNTDREITEVFENDENGEFRMNSRVIREITDAGSSQDDMIIYDFIKSITMRFMDYDVKSYNNETDVNTGFALAFNTLLSEGIIEEIN